MTDRYRAAWQSARQRAAVLSTELTRRAPLLGEYAAENIRLHQWHDEDRTALTEMRATIERLRTERDSFRDQRNAVFATNEQLHAQVLESDQARLRAENDARTAKREVAPPAPAGQSLRDRIAQALAAVDGPTWSPTATEYRAAADAVLAVLPTPADQAPPLLAEVWTVWREDEPVWGHFATEAAGKTGTIDYYEEQEERCPDYGWRRDEERLELLAGGETTGIYLSRHPVFGKPAPADRAAEERLGEELDEAAATIAELTVKNGGQSAALGRVREWVTSDVVTATSEFGNGYREAQRDIRDLLDGRRMADAPQQVPGCAACEAGIAHTEHCPTPESHNAGCGCPTDQAGEG